MKILMLTPYLPYPPASGGQIRTLNLLKYLSRNHEITLVSLYKNEQEKAYADELKSYCRAIYPCKRPEKPWQLNNVLKAVFSFLPFLIVRNYSSEARQTIEKLLRENEYDIIHAETFYIMPHIPPTKLPVLLVEQTIEYKVYLHFLKSVFVLLRWALTIDIVKLRAWELYYWKKASTVATVSASDELIIKQQAHGIDPVIIPNGAGDEMFVEDIEKSMYKEQKLLFMGNFFWLQNTEAALYLMEKVFPEVQKALPHIKLVIAGQNAKNTLPPVTNPGIAIVDIAQDDTAKVKTMYHDASLFIAPIFGPGGTRLKILAAIASGLPVISSKTGIEGLELENEEHVLLANTTAEFVQQITRALSDEQLYRSLKTAAYEVAKNKYSWRSISEKLEIVYQSITKVYADKH